MNFFLKVELLILHHFPHNIQEKISSTQLHLKKFQAFRNFIQAIKQAEDILPLYTCFVRKLMIRIKKVIVYCIYLIITPLFSIK